MHYSFTLCIEIGHLIVPVFHDSFTQFIIHEKQNPNVITSLPLAQRTEPYAINNVNRLNGRLEPKSSSNLPLQNESNAKAGFGGLSVSQTSEPQLKETKTSGRLSVSQNLDVVKDPKSLSCKQFS